VASFRLAVRMVAELRQLFVEVLNSGLALLQEIGDKPLLAVFHRFLLCKDFLATLGAVLFRHGRNHNAHNPFTRLPVLAGATTLRCATPINALISPDDQEGSQP